MRIFMGLEWGTKLLMPIRHNPPSFLLPKRSPIGSLLPKSGDLPMATTMGEEAAAFIRACEAIHSLVEQGTLQPDDRDLIEVSITDLRAKLEMYT